jgi:hypothetical protein
MYPSVCGPLGVIFCVTYTRPKIQNLNNIRARKGDFLAFQETSSPGKLKLVDFGKDCKSVGRVGRDACCYKSVIQICDKEYSSSSTGLNDHTE